MQGAAGQDIVRPIEDCLLSLPCPFNYISDRKRRITYQERRLRTKAAALIALGAALIAASPAVWAQDKLKIGVGQRGNYDTAISEVG